MKSLAGRYLSMKREKLRYDWHKAKRMKMLEFPSTPILHSFWD